MAVPQPELGHRIRAARERLDMTQEALGAAVGRSRSAVNAWETGRAVPMRSVARLEDVLGVSLRNGAELKPPPIPRRIEEAIRASGLTPEEQDRVRRAIERVLTGQPGLPPEEPPLAKLSTAPAAPCLPGAI